MKIWKGPLPFFWKTWHQPRCEIFRLGSGLFLQNWILFTSRSTCTELKNLKKIWYRRHWFGLARCSYHRLCGTAWLWFRVVGLLWELFGRLLTRWKTAYVSLSAYIHVAENAFDEYHGIVLRGISLYSCLLHSRLLCQETAERPGFQPVWAVSWMENLDHEPEISVFITHSVNPCRSECKKRVTRKNIVWLFSARCSSA